MPKPLVIVVNSLVSYGSVGGRASLFTLQRLGFPVVFVPTVTFTWHRGHGPATRTAPPGADFAESLQDIVRAPWLREVGGVLSGYFGDAGQIGATAQLVTAVKAANPAALYLCDPIIGDGGRLFQPEAIADGIGDRLLPRADIATPNRFELEWLSTGEASNVTADARRLGPPEIVVTSADDRPDRMTNLVVTRDAVVQAAHARLPSVPHGTGDLLAALYLAHRLDRLAPAAALERASSAVLRVVRLAAELGVDELPLSAGQDAFAAAPSDVEMSFGG